MNEIFLKDFWCKKNIYWILLISIIFFHFINNIYFLFKYPLPEGKDSVAHITTFLNFSQIIKNGSMHPFYIPGRSWLFNLVFIVLDYPPFFYFVAFLINLLMGQIFLQAALFTASLFFVLLIISIYKIGAIFGRSTGILAAFICSFYPAIFLTSRHFSLELALCAMVSLGIWLLLKTKFFKSLFYSVMLGIILGLGQLTKQTFFLYISGPLIISIGFFYIQNWKFKKFIEIRNMVFCCIVFLCISGIFYWSKDIYISAFNRAQFMGAVKDMDIFSPQHLTYYFRSLRDTMGNFFIAIFLFSLFFFDFKNRYYFCLMLLWILIPVVVFSCVVLKYGEYSIPYLPAFALVSAAGIQNIKNKYFKVLLISLIFFIGVINYFSISYSRTKMYYSTYHASNPRTNIVRMGTPHSFFQKTFVSWQDVLKEIDNSINIVGVFYDDLRFSFPHYFMRTSFSYTRKRAQIIDFFFRPTTFLRHLDKFNYIIFITCSNKQWIDKESWDNFIDKFNRENFTKICYETSDEKNIVTAEMSFGKSSIIISKKISEELINLNQMFLKVYEIDFCVGKKSHSFEKVYIYKRRP